MFIVNTVTGQSICYYQQNYIPHHQKCTKQTHYHCWLHSSSCRWLLIRSYGCLSNVTSKHHFKQSMLSTNSGMLPNSEHHSITVCPTPSFAYHSPPTIDGCRHQIIIHHQPVLQGLQDVFAFQLRQRQAALLRATTECRRSFGITYVGNGRSISIDSW